MEPECDVAHQNKAGSGASLKDLSILAQPGVGTARAYPGLRSPPTVQL
jgi:hypothetical protein